MTTKLLAILLVAFSVGEANAFACATIADQVYCGDSDARPRPRAIDDVTTSDPGPSEWAKDYGEQHVRDMRYLGKMHRKADAAWEKARHGKD